MMTAATMQSLLIVILSFFTLSSVHCVPINTNDKERDYRNHHSEIKNYFNGHFNDQNSKRLSTQEICPFKCVCVERFMENSDTMIISNITCSNKGLTKIPENMPRNVVHLNLSGNSIEEISPSLSSLVKLNFLSLSNNNIKKITDGTFYSLKRLKFLDLSHNQLEYIGEKAFKEDKNYEMFNDGAYKEFLMENENDDDSIDNDKSIHASLKYCIINDNKLKKIEGAFNGMESLVNVDLGNNYITEISDSTFRDAQNLQRLTLSHNNLKRIHPNAFIHNSKLNNIKLQSNPLLYMVTSLNLATNNHLNYIDLSDCKLTRVLNFKFPSSLKYLKLRNNNIKELKKKNFPVLQNLNILLLDGNKISKIQDDMFSEMTSLQQLWLNDNFLTSFPVSLPNTLQRLLLDNNQISYWPNKSFFSTDDYDVPQLKTLSMSTNKLEQLNLDSLSSLHYMQVFDVSENNLIRLEANSFKQNSQLKNLNLNSNPIEEISSYVFQGANSLESLSMSKVGRKGRDVLVEKNFLKPLQTSLTSLDLNHSPKIIQKMLLDNNKNLEDFTLSQMKSLTEVQMAGSRLEELSDSEIKMMLSPSISSFTLTSSHWICDSRIKSFLRFLLSEMRIIRGANKNKCGYPNNLFKREVLSLKEDELIEGNEIDAGKQNYNEETRLYNEDDIEIFDTSSPNQKGYDEKNVNSYEEIESFDKNENGIKNTNDKNIHSSMSKDERNDKLQAVNNDFDKGNTETTNSHLYKYFDNKDYDEEYQLLKANFKAKNISMLIIACTAVVAIVIIFLILFLLYNKRKNKKAQLAAFNQPEDKKVLKQRSKNGVLYFSTSSIGPKPDMLPDQETISEAGSVFKSNDIFSPMALNYPDSTISNINYDKNNNCLVSNKNFKIFNTHHGSNGTFNESFNGSYHNYNSCCDINKGNRMSLSSSVSKVNSPTSWNVINTNSFYGNTSYNLSPSHGCNVNPAKKTNTYRWEDI